MLQSILKSRWFWPGCGLLLGLGLVAALLGPVWYEMYITRKTVAMIEAKYVGDDSAYGLENVPPRWLSAGNVERVTNVFPQLFQRVRHLTLLEDEKNGELDFRLICQNRELQSLFWRWEQNRDETLHDIARLRRLEYVLLTGGKISAAGLSAWNELRDLKEIYLSELELQRSEATPVPVRLPRLESLGLIKVRLSSSPLHDFRHCTGLQSLGVVSSPWHAGASGPLRDLRALEKCRFNQVKLTHAMLGDVISLPALRQLFLTECQIEPGQLQHLAASASLRELVIAQWEVDDSYIEELVKLTQLEFLDVDSTNISTAGIRQLKKRLPGCTINSHNAPIREEDE